MIGEIGAGGDQRVDADGEILQPSSIKRGAINAMLDLADYG